MIESMRWRWVGNVVWRQQPRCFVMMVLCVLSGSGCASSRPRRQDAGPKLSKMVSLDDVPDRYRPVCLAIWEALLDEKARSWTGFVPPDYRPTPSGLVREPGISEYEKKKIGRDLAFCRELLKELGIRLESKAKLSLRAEPGVCDLAQSDRLTFVAESNDVDLYLALIEVPFRVSPELVDITPWLVVQRRPQAFQLTVFCAPHFFLTDAGQERVHQVLATRPFATRKDTQAPTLDEVAPLTELGYGGVFAIQDVWKRTGYVLSMSVQVADRARFMNDMTAWAFDLWEYLHFNEAMEPLLEECAFKNTILDVKDREVIRGWARKLKKAGIDANLREATLRRRPSPWGGIYPTDAFDLP
jgi:hypothetical protein